jgi:hypothetical protein
MMYPTNFKLAKFKATFGGYRFLLPILLFLTIFSCRKKEIVNQGEYSDAFKKVSDRFTHFKPKKPSDEMVYLDSAFRQISNLTVNDRFRYYASHLCSAINLITIEKMNCCMPIVCWRWPKKRPAQNNTYPTLLRPILPKAMPILIPGNIAMPTNVFMRAIF